MAAAVITAATTCTTPAHALEPKDIAVLYRNDDPQSIEVADHYARARSIPRGNLIGITCNADQVIPEALYRTSIVPQVQKAIASQHLDAVKCLVTVYGLPLTIGPQDIGAALRSEVNNDQNELHATLQRLSDAVAAYDHIAPAPTPTTAPAKAPATLEFTSVIHRLTTAMNAAGHRIQPLTGAERSHAFLQMVEMQRNVAGIFGVISSFHLNPDTPDDDPARTQMDALAAQLKEITAQLASLQTTPTSPPIRAQQVNLQLRAHGLIGEAQELTAQLQQLAPTETESCFDNELALVLDDQNYPRYRFLQNPTNIEFFPTARRFMSIPAFASDHPIPLMVCRLDGLTPEAVDHMIDTTLAVEKTGLNGKIYLDARGLHGTDGYSLYDNDIRAAAAWLKSNSTLDVTLDDTPNFLEAKNCPDAALYCGWYSLHQYRDSCQWVQGAVGYHVASFEMVTLHNPKETGWVSNLLQRGFCGTLGATNEPYLIAFPKPSQFFPLLLCGEFTQGEVWEVTCPLTSWRIGYVGDPLYNPFKHHPRVTLQTLKADPILRNAFTILRSDTPLFPTRPITGRASE
jgi:uncharacterized protein (TIGR03790 family)